MQQSMAEKEVKIVLLGEAGVGKSGKKKKKSSCKFACICSTAVTLLKPMMFTSDLFLLP